MDSPAEKQADKQYAIAVNEDGSLSVRLDQEIGLGQDLLLEIFSEVQAKQAELRRELKVVERQEEEEHQTWWPESLVCTTCKETIQLNEEPDSYVIFCTKCSNALIVEPDAAERDREKNSHKS